MSSRQTKAFIAGILVCALVNAPIGSAMAADAISINFGNQHIPTRGIKRVILKGADEESSPF